MWPTMIRMWRALSRKPARRTSPRRPGSHPRLEALEDRCLLSAGALDPAFGSGGIVNPVAYGVAGMAIYPNSGTANDGKIVTAGTDGSVTYNAFGVARYNANGTLDSSFGTGGKVSTRVGKYWDTVSATAIQSDGKILVVGDSMFMVHGTLSGHQINLLRYNANGSLDSTFGSKGVATFNFSSTSATEAGAVAVLPGGKIVVAGWVNSPNALALVRFNSNGSLDTTFGTGGSVQIHFSGAISEPDNGWPVRLAIQPDGKLAILGTVTIYVPAIQNYDTFAALARVNSNGTLDGSFGSGGEVVAALGPSASQASGLALQPDGKFVVVGKARNTHDDLALARFNSNGALDSSFNGTGLLDLDIHAAPYNADSYYPDNGLTDVAIQGDGKIVASGLTEAGESINANGYSRFALLRVNRDGGVDSTFGNAGLVVTDVTPGGDVANAVFIQSDGKILLGGTGLARYLPSAPQIGSFTASASAVTAGSSLTLTASNITDGNPGATVTQVDFYATDSSGNRNFLGYGTNNNGVWTLAFTVSLAPGSYTLFAEATDSLDVLGADSALLNLTVQ
jgi:uncharacterized delta-60 repeat protein